MAEIIYTNKCPKCGEELISHNDPDLSYGMYYWIIQCPKGCYYWEGYFGECEDN